MKHSFLPFWTISLCFLATSILANPCSVNLKNTEIRNSEFYIDFTKVVENILIKHGYNISENEADYHFVAKNFITTGTTYFQLKQVNIEFAFSGEQVDLNLHELKNCMTVSCTSDRYLKALKGALKEFDQRLENCSK